MGGCTTRLPSPPSPSAAPALSFSAGAVASSLIRSSLKRSLRLLRDPLSLEPPSFSSSLFSIISGLLVSVATELAVFLLGDGAADAEFCSLDELRESHEKGLLNLRPVEAGAGAGAGGLFDQESFAWGDHGMGGRALAMLLRDIVLEDVFSSGGGLFSGEKSQCAVPTAPCWAHGWVGGGTCLGEREPPPSLLLPVLLSRRHRG